MSRLFHFISLVLFPLVASSQIIQLGGEQSEGIRATTSSVYQPESWSQEADGLVTINGEGLTADLQEASRFLAQATLGADHQEIYEVAQMGLEAWLDQQFTLAPTLLIDILYEVQQERDALFLANGGDSTELGGRPGWVAFNYAWWDTQVRAADMLRHRIALALSEIFVISIRSDLEGFGDGLASFYDVFQQHAFGNYRDLLRDVSLHPCMGYFLSHLNNPRAVPEENTFPDENYAREAMQLFSIGLYELNPDGTHKRDGSGNEIPTYSQQDVKEFAKIWTGLGPADVIPNMYEDEAYFGMSIWSADMTLPLKMYQDYHESGEKRLLKGTVVPSGQTGMQDIEAAIDNLFNHPNVGPFIGRLLIQRLVKSNPSPAYIEAVSEAFADNGAGVRGDMKAVIKAILLHEEARSCDWMMHSTQGMLREPFVRYTHFARAMQLEQYYNRYWNIGYSFWESTGQTVFGAPSVFNFFLPDHMPNGPIGQAGLVAPEFQIHNSRTSIGMINHVNYWAVYRSVFDNWEENDPNTFVNIDDLKELARDPEVLVNELDLLFTHGMLSDRTRGIIKEAIEPMVFGDFRDDRVRLALYLIMISPDYAILK